MRLQRSLFLAWPASLLVVQIAMIAVGALWAPGRAEAAVGVAAENPCSNGSFEQLDASGFPAHWSWVGPQVSVSSDAHRGARSLRMLRLETTSNREETGLNRGWRSAENRTALVDRLRGGVDFYYKAVSAKNADLQVYVIPVNVEQIEKTGSSRARYTVPKAHVGDGRWHQGRLKYDFTKDPAVKAVHFAARIEGRAGELLLDDFSYVERVGAALRLGTPRIETSAGSSGGRCVLQVNVDNAGDAPAENVRATAEPPPGLSTLAQPLALGAIPPGGRALATWTLEGNRDRPATIPIRVEAGGFTCETRLVLAPQVEVVCAGPDAPVVFHGEAAVLRCRLANRGNATAPAPSVEFRYGDTTVRPATSPIPPGESVEVSCPFRPMGIAVSLPIVVTVRAGEGAPHVARSSLQLLDQRWVGPHAERLDAQVAGNVAVLQNTHLRLVFYRTADGFGPGEVWVRTPRAGWQSVAWMPQLTTLVCDVPGTTSEGPTSPAFRPVAVRLTPIHAELDFEGRPKDRPDARIRVRFTLGPSDRSVAVRHELAWSGAKPMAVRRFDGPTLYVTRRDEAVFPGLEWLVDDEVSSGTLDIAEGHADRVRYVVHPNFITIPAIGVHSLHGAVGLFWDVHQKWDGRRDRPSAVFASPDRFGNQQSHMLGLFLPSVPEFVDVNRREASRPYALAPGRTLALESHVLADGAAADALAPIDAWIRRFGIPEPNPIPRGAYDNEVAFSMQGYLKSLWDPASKSWWTSKGGGTMSTKDRPHAFVADLLLGTLYAQDGALRDACRRRADEVLPLLGTPARIDRLRWPASVGQYWANSAAISELLAQRNAQGAWAFDAHQVGAGPFEGLDYRELGPHEAVELGLCARKAFDALQYARITGDREVYQQMIPTLETMAGRFRVPRAAQVWEVPVHCPDILAAADAIDAFLEGYAVSGERRWLDAARSWARRGLPFVYLWNDPKQPFLLGASIPVFGATWYQGSWFGRPVQWNGLHYAESILKLADCDAGYPWRKIAASAVHSALYQQDASGENVALWPDNLSAVNGEKCAWVFAPREVLHTMLKLAGRDEDPQTVILGSLPARLHISAAAAIDQAHWDGATCHFRVAYPRGEQGVVLVYNVARPKAVLLDRQPIEPRSDVARGDSAGWRYDAPAACLAIRIAGDRPTSVRVDGAAWRYVDRMPRPAAKIDFTFSDGLQGWTAINHIDDLTIADGQLQGRIVGPDPYLVRAGLRIPPNACRTIAICMKVDAGRGGEFYFGTAAAPGFTPERTLPFAMIADGRFHDYRLDVGKHPAWAGQTVTAIRIDPGNGAPTGTFAIQWVRGE